MFFDLNAFIHSVGNLLLNKWHVFAISIPLTCCLFIYEMSHMGWQNSSLRRLFVKPSMSALTDLVCCILYITNLRLYMAVLLSFGLAPLVPNFIRYYLGYDLLSKIENPIISFFIILLISDFIGYWKHRLNHEIKCLWELHKFHHSATELNMITTHRLHPLNGAISNLIFCLPVAIAGVQIESYVSFLIFNNLHQCIKHSNLPFNWGWLGKYVFVSPVAHKIHHSQSAEHLNKNYGTTFVVWDHIFGTWYNGGKINELVGPLDRSYSPKSWYVEIWECYIGFWKELFNSTKRLITSIQ